MIVTRRSADEEDAPPELPAPQQPGAGGEGRHRSSAAHCNAGNGPSGQPACRARPHVQHCCGGEQNFAGRSVPLENGHTRLRLKQAACTTPHHSMALGRRDKPVNPAASVATAVACGLQHSQVALTARKQGSMACAALTWLVNERLARRILQTELRQCIY